jgi:hypothetical protein
MANNYGANDIDAIIFDVETGLHDAREPALRESPSGITTTAYPFSEADLDAFTESGEHLGLD